MHKEATFVVILRNTTIDSVFFMDPSTRINIVFNKEMKGRSVLSTRD